MIRFKVFGTYMSLDFYFISLCVILIIYSKIDFMISFILSALHEIGHIFFIIMYRIPIKEINITPYSVDIIQETSSLSYKKEFSILLAGPLMNFLLFMIFFFIYLCSNLIIFKDIYLQSLLIGLINLIPISTLDGGRILQIFLKKRFGVREADKISFIVSIIFIISLMISGFLVLIRSNFNISILFLSLYLCYFLISQKWNDKVSGTFGGKILK